jgi:hypothetical protein
MQRISSNFTLFFKIFIPVFWTVFYGAFTITLLFADPGDLGYLSRGLIPYSNLGFYLATLLIIYLTLWKLKRVELDAEYFYVTNYFKTFRYTYHSIAEIRTTSLLVFQIMTIEFNKPSSFGNRVHFILEPRLLKDFNENNPEVLAGLWPPPSSGR